MNKTIRLKQQNLKLIMAVFIIIGLLLFAYGFIHITETDKPYVIPKQDLQVHRFTKFGESLTIIATAYLKPDYNLIYSYEKTPISLNLEFDECNDCPELENGLTFWFFYEKINGSGSGGSIVSYLPDEDFYNINIKPGEKKELNGWIIFTGEGIYRHVFWNSTHGIRLESNEKTFVVYPNYIINQIRSNRIIESFSAITVGVSFIMLAFICFQSYSNIENRIEQGKEFKKLSSKLDEIKIILGNNRSKQRNKKRK